MLSVTAAVAVLATLASKDRDAWGTKGLASGGATWTVGLGRTVRQAVTIAAGATATIDFEVR